MTLYAILMSTLHISLYIFKNSRTHYHTAYCCKFVYCYQINTFDQHTFDTLAFPLSCIKYIVLSHF